MRSKFVATDPETGKDVLFDTPNECKAYEDSIAMSVAIRKSLADSGAPKRKQTEYARVIAEWEVGRRIQSIPGVAEVLSMGGGVTQIQEKPDPDNMLAAGVTFEQLRAAA